MNKTPTIYANSLVLEITRHCNMYCEHCIRGDAQNLDIDTKTINMVAKHIHAETITFSGGEPSLNIKAMKQYFKAAEKYDSIPDSFYVVTNGKENQEELAETLLRMYSRCSYKEMCGVDISHDRFHDNCIDFNNHILRGLSFFIEDGHKHNTNEPVPKWIINDGRAKENGWGSRPEKALETRFENIVDSVINDYIYVEELYVSANGWVVSDCDVSYNRMDTEHICHISELPHIAREYMKSHSIG